MEENFQGGVPTGTQNPGSGGAGQVGNLGVATAGQDSGFGAAGAGQDWGKGVNISHVEQAAPADASADEKADAAVVDQFVEGLIMKKGLSDMNELQNLKKELREELVGQINQSLLYALSDEEFAKLEAKGDNFTEEDFRAAIRNSGVDVEKVTKETVEKFENVFMGIKLEEVA